MRKFSKLFPFQNKSGGSEFVWVTRVFKRTVAIPIVPPIYVTLLKTKSSHFVSQIAQAPGNWSKLALMSQKRVANVSLLMRNLK